MMHRHTLTETVEKYELSGASLKSVICMKWLPGFLKLHQNYTELATWC